MLYLPGVAIAIGGKMKYDELKSIKIDLLNRLKQLAENQISLFASNQHGFRRKKKIKTYRKAMQDLIDYIQYVYLKPLSSTETCVSNICSMAFLTETSYKIGYLIQLKQLIEEKSTQLQKNMIYCSAIEAMHREIQNLLTLFEVKLIVLGRSKSLARNSIQLLIDTQSLKGLQFYLKEDHYGFKINDYYFEWNSDWQYDWQARDFKFFKGKFIRDSSFYEFRSFCYKGIITEIKQKRLS